MYLIFERFLMRGVVLLIYLWIHLTPNYVNP